MAKCVDCRREMLLATTCVETIRIAARGKVFDRIPHSLEERERCWSCGVKPGGVHHFGCDLERCPECDGQLIMCGAEAHYDGSVVGFRLHKTS